MAQRGRGAAAGARPAARPARDDGARRPGHDLGAVRARLRAVVEPIIAAAGLDFEDVTVTRAGRRHLVRVVVDAEGGVDHDELGEVSRDISAALDAAERPGGDLRGLVALESYTLEVSSPGVDRPLTLPRHWRRNVGRLVKVRAGGATVTARIIAADNDAVTLDSDRDVRTYALDQLGPGRVQVEFREAGDRANGSDAGELEDDA